ncbi:MAG TPA: rhodanese-like domain-containing protein [Saprospiraceae bacterium]|nr:rhodanese-like domain-containing protein [Saprospiraceae bacterium]
MKNVNKQEFKKMMSEKDVVVLDVRTPREFESGKIEGAVNIPLNIIAKKAETLDKSKKYLVYCRSGARSRRAAMILARKGFEVYNLTGGYLSWMRH